MQTEIPSRTIMYALNMMRIDDALEMYTYLLHHVDPIAELDYNGFSITLNKY